MRFINECYTVKFYSFDGKGTKKCDIHSQNKTKSQHFVIIYTFIVSQSHFFHIHYYILYKKHYICTLETNIEHNSL